MDWKEFLKPNKKKLEYSIVIIPVAFVICLTIIHVSFSYLSFIPFVILCYLLSCCIVWFLKTKKSKKIKTPYFENY